MTPRGYPIFNSYMKIYVFWYSRQMDGQTDREINPGGDWVTAFLKIKTFPTMLKLISGAVIGGVNYEEIYMDSDIDDETNPPITTHNMGEDQNTNIHKLPNLPETARKVARLEKRKLNEKQYIAYKMIACTFLLGLVHGGNNPNTTLYLCLRQTMGITANLKINNIVHRLEARGGQSQLMMFLTELTGSENSTAIKIAQQFCYDFCLAVVSYRVIKHSCSLHTLERQQHCLVVLLYQRLHFSINKRH